MPPFMAGPIDAGLCMYGDVYKLTLSDFANMNEILAVRVENQARAHKAAERNRKRK